MPKNPVGKVFARAVLPVLVAFVVGCGESAAPDPVLLERTDGDGQEAVAGTGVEDPLRLRVASLDSTPRNGVHVEWTVVEGGGVLEGAATTSDADGSAEALWILGSEPGEQRVRATAGAESVTFEALATSPPPDDWAEVLEVRPWAGMDGQTVRAHVWIFNRWDGTIRIRASSSCLSFPALYDADTGERVRGSGRGCWAAPRTRSVAPGDSLYDEWEIDAATLDPGEYTVHYHFDEHLLVNGQPTTLETPEMDVTVGG